MFNEEYIAAQPRGESGFVEVFKSNDPNIKAIQKEIDDYAKEFRENGIRLNKEFHDTIGALKNYAAQGGDANEIYSVLNAVDNRVKNGEFAPKPANKDFKPQNNFAPQNQTQNASGNGAVAKKKFESFKNDKGYTIVSMPKNEIQQAIADEFQAFFEQNIKGMGFSKDFINSFWDSRNYNVRTEKSSEEVQKALQIAMHKINNYDKSANQSNLNSGDLALILQKLDEMQNTINAQNAKIDDLTKRLAVKSSQNAFVRSNDRSIDAVPKDVTSAAIQVVKETWIQMGKNDPSQQRSKEDYQALYAVDRVEYSSVEEFKGALNRVEAKVQSRIDERNAKNAQSAQNNGASGDGDGRFEADPNDSSALDEIIEQERQSQRPPYKKGF